MCFIQFSPFFASDFGVLYKKEVLYFTCVFIIYIKIILKIFYCRDKISITITVIVVNYCYRTGDVILHA